MSLQKWHKPHIYLNVSIYYGRVLFIAQIFLRSLIELGKYTVHSDGWLRYPKDCYSLGLKTKKHILHSSFEKGMIERNIE
jgi:hypothetical protein